MLRQAVTTTLRRRVIAVQRRGFTTDLRGFTTAAQKRALNKQQLGGDKGKDAGGGKKPTPPTAGPAATTTGGAGTTKPPPPSSSNNNALIGAVLVAGVGIGGYMYYTSQQQNEEEPTKKVESAPPKTEAKEEKKPVAPKTEPKKAEPEKAEPEKPKAVAKQPPKEEKKPAAPKEAEPGGNRVATIDVQTGSSRASQVVPAVSHPVGGHRVAMEPPKPEPEATAADAARELQSTQDDAASVTLQKAHQALRANLDESLLQDLDKLSESELKIRVVQLAAEMKERTKWEAVRLKEFLAMKEKETADKYMEILQQQRLEFEGLMARRLLEQEEVLNRHANEALQEKENNIQAVVTAAAEAQEAEHQADLKSTEERLDRELNAKYETDYSTKLANEKAEFAKELESKVSAVEELSEKLQKLDGALQASRSYESGSQRLHRVNAAALALGAKLETNQGASEEVAAMKAATGDSGVIASALSTIPASVNTGVPTLSELQTRFATVKKRSRQAALVPEGRVDLGGQLMGIAFSTLKYDPSPDEPAPAEDKDAPDYVLARAQRDVQLGDLERAVEQLDKLQGQAAFTVRDWKKDATDRIAIQKALNVIRMECALLNESMSGGTASAE